MGYFRTKMHKISGISHKVKQTLVVIKRLKISLRQIDDLDVIYTMGNKTHKSCVSLYIMETCPCNIKRFLKEQMIKKTKTKTKKKKHIFIFLLFVLKT